MTQKFGPIRPWRPTLFTRPRLGETKWQSRGENFARTCAFVFPTNIFRISEEPGMWDNSTGFSASKNSTGKGKVLPVQKKSRPRLVCPCSFSILKQRMWYGLVCLSQLATDINQLKKRRGRIFRKVNNWIKIRVGDDEEIARCMEFLFSCLCPSCVRIAGTREQSWKKLWKLNPRLSHIIPIGS